ncbi:MAG: hypothetical protein EOO85_21600 [Pedobacter sp.]|nr:MAG: hypothetical protein EOO85_21600 [Pedobacter sp.]
MIQFYKDQLQGVGDIGFQEVSDDVNPNWWLPTISSVKQREILKALNDGKMQSRPFWVPMNQLRMFKDNIFYNKTDRSNHIYQHCLSIPCSTNITDADLQRVSDTIKNCF